MDQAAKVVQTQSTTGPSIELHQLAKSYGKQSVLANLTLKVEPGEFFVVLGESGCGKSTLLRLIAGLEKPDAGSVQLAGVAQANIPPHRRDVSMVFQNGNGYDHLTVRENLDFASKASAENSEPVAKWIELLGLGACLKQKLHQLSGGQLQRVAIARAFLSGRSTLLFDEPLAHLNTSVRIEIRELIHRVQRETKRTMVYVTHDSEEAFYLATTIGVLAQGAIQQVASPRAIFETPISAQIAMHLATPPICTFQLPSSWFGDGKLDQPVLCGIRPHDWKIESIAPVDASLRVEQVQSDGELLRLRGAVTECRWLGTRWHLKIRVAAPVRQSARDRPDSKSDHIELEITCPSSPSMELEDDLRKVGDATAAGSPKYAITAIVHKSTVRRLTQ